MLLTQAALGVVAEGGLPGGEVGEERLAVAVAGAGGAERVDVDHHVADAEHRFGPRRRLRQGNAPGANHEQESAHEEARGA